MSIFDFFKRDKDNNKDKNKDKNKDQELEDEELQDKELLDEELEDEKSQDTELEDEKLQAKELQEKESEVEKLQDKELEDAQAKESQDKELEDEDQKFQEQEFQEQEEEDEQSKDEKREEPVDKKIADSDDKVFAGPDDKEIADSDDEVTADPDGEKKANPDCEETTVLDEKKSLNPDGEEVVDLDDEETADSDDEIILDPDDGETADSDDEIILDPDDEETADKGKESQDKEPGDGKDKVKNNAVRTEQDEADRVLQDEEDVEKGFFQRLKEGLARSRQGFVDKVSSVFSRSQIDDDFYEELEETLIQADVGVKATLDLISDLKQEVEEQEITEPEELYQVFQEKIRNILGENDQVLKPWEDLKVLMIVGVNGAGKTTTIAKLAHRYQKQGKKVLLAAGDTFRAGAIDQIKEWGRRLNTDVISQSEGADAAAVAYDAVQAARSRKADLLIVDTAGRLHTQKNLMEELKKVRRVIGRETGEEAVEVMLVIDATTGQNALNQAKIFNEAVSIDGITLTKLDGTARGGIVLAIKKELDLPIRLIGVGERAADLQDFNPEKFVEALFSSN